MVVPGPQTGMRCALIYFLAELRDSVDNENRNLVKEYERATGPSHGSIPACRNSASPRNVRTLETIFFFWKASLGMLHLGSWAKNVIYSFNRG